MPRKVYVMNELLFENLNKLLETITQHNLSKPFYSVTDDGQLVSIVWDTNENGKSVIGTMKNTEVTWTCYVDDLYEKRATFMLPQQNNEAIMFVKSFLEN